MEADQKKQSRDSEILATGILLMAFAPFISDVVWLSALVTAGGAALVLIGTFLLRSNGIRMKFPRLRGNRTLLVALLSAWAVGWAWIVRLFFLPFPSSFLGFIETAIVGIIWLSPLFPFFAWGWKTMRSQTVRAK